jgi:hypothetical protein
MNTARFVGAALAIWIVRVALNWTFYTRVVGRQMEQISAAHPDMFRIVIPAYIVTDLLFAVVFALLFVRVGAALGGGLKAGVALGIFVAILSPVVANLYEYFSVRYLPVGLMATVSVFQAIAHTVEGGVAGLIYKT